MKNKPFSILIVLIIAALTLSACNLPNRHEVNTPAGTVAAPTQGSTALSSLCSNAYFPNTSGDKWEYTGTDSVIGTYNRTDTITDSSSASFTQETNLGNVTYSVTYDCSTVGLTSRNPIQQYAGALLNNPDVPVDVKLTSNSGVSLPTRINPGDTWQQTADWEATSQQLNVNGRFVFNYAAAGYESITVPAGTYNALRVTTTIQVEVTSFHVTAGSYTIVSWWVPEIGLVKSEGTSHVTGINFTDSMELTKFTPAS